MPAGVSRAHRLHAVAPGNGEPAAPQLRVIQAGSCPFVQNSSVDPETLQARREDENTSQASTQAPTASDPTTGSRHAPARGIASPPRTRPEGIVGKGKAGVRQALELTDLQVDCTETQTAIGCTPSATRPQTAIGRTQSAITRSPSADPAAHHHNFTEAQLESYQVLSVRVRDADAQLRLRGPLCALRVLCLFPLATDIVASFLSSGTITILEIGTVLRSLGQAPTYDELQAMVAEVDDQGNGKIDFDQFLRIMKKKIQETKHDESEVLEVFRVFDHGQSGTVGTMELRTILNNLGEELAPEEVEELIADARPDENGRINYREFMAMMLSETT